MERRGTSGFRRLLKLDARLDDDVAPHRDFAGDPLGEALRAGGADVEADIAQLLGDPGSLSTASVSRATRWTIASGVPAGAYMPWKVSETMSGKPDFLHGRHVGQIEPAPLAGDRQRAQRARLDVRMGRRQGGDADRRGLRQDRLDGRAGAVIGNVLDRRCRP